MQSAFASSKDLALNRTFGSMRLLVLLLAMYVLVLSGVPCDTLCQDEPVAAAGQGAPAHSDEQGDCKSCSPFSMCAACTGFTLPASAWVQNTASGLPTPAPAHLPLYQAPYAREVAVCIWQPPRCA